MATVCDTDDVCDSEYVCGRHDDCLMCVCDRWEKDDGLFVCVAGECGGGSWSYWDW